MAEVTVNADMDIRKNNHKSLLEEKGYSNKGRLTMVALTAIQKGLKNKEDITLAGKEYLSTVKILGQEIKDWKLTMEDNLFQDDPSDEETEAYGREIL